MIFTVHVQGSHEAREFHNVGSAVMRVMCMCIALHIVIHVHLHIHTAVAGTMNIYLPRYLWDEHAGCRGGRGGGG